MYKISFAIIFFCQRKVTLAENQPKAILTFRRPVRQDTKLQLNAFLTPDMVIDRCRHPTFRDN